MKPAKAAFLLLLLAFSGMQLIRPTKNADAKTAPDLDVFARIEAPAEVRETMRSACYDCHSNGTRYPWYAEVQPGGWLLARHVRKGKAALNLSEFGELSPRNAQKALEAIADEVAERRMPLRSYTWAHPEARLTSEQVEGLSRWAEEAALRAAPRGSASARP